MKPLYEKPTPARMPFDLPTKEEFLIWCQSPVTQFVALSYKIAADLQKEDWMQKSWNGGQSDPLTLAIFKAREDAYKGFLEAEYEDHLNFVKIAK